MKKILFSSGILILLIVMYACNNEGNVTSSTKNSDYISEMVMIDENIPVNSAFSPIVEATFDNEMSLTELQLQGMGHGRHGDMRNMKRFGKGPWGLGRILYELELTDDQKTQVDGFLTEYHNCIKEAMANLREQIKPILEAANAERRAILERLKTDPDYTRQQAHEDLKALNERVRQAIQDLRFNDAYCECLRSLLSNIAGILNEDQNAKWDEWFNSLKGPCFDTTE